MLLRPFVTGRNRPVLHFTCRACHATLLVQWVKEDRQKSGISARQIITITGNRCRSGWETPSCSSIGNGFFLSLFIFIILFWRFFDEIESSRVDMGSMIRIGQRAGGVKRSSPLGHPFNFLVKLRSSKNIVYSKKLSFVIVQKQGPSFPMNQINTFTRMKEWQNSRHAMPG